MAKVLYQNNRKQDTETTQEVEKYLDKYYEGKIPYVRVTTRSLQYAGIDVILKSSTGDDMLVDEKCATDYIGKDLETFSFELRSSSDRNGYRYDGWFLSDKIQTTHYMICYINRAKVDKHPKVSDIQEMEIMLINKIKIQEYLKSKGLSYDKLINICNSIDAGADYRGDIKEGYKFAKSKHKIESPISILIPRSELRAIALHNDIIRTP